MKGLGDEGLDLSKLADPEPRYTLQELLGSGVYSDVHLALDNETGKRVAVKVVRWNPDSKLETEEEYRILRDLSSHPNLPDFYGVYLKKSNSPTIQDQLWLVMQLCEGGPVTDLVRGLIQQNKRMSEVHIAYILKETIKALCHLHEHHVMHRDVKGTNILLTKEGEVKLVDFGISREMGSTLGKCRSSLGTPSYMAPEVVSSSVDNTPYDNRSDVWALGITAIELGDGISPYQDMHPTRALFQIVRNPPPSLYRPANWTQDYNDFIAECLVKNPEHRPYMNEVIEHPFLTQLPENDFHLSIELKTILESVKTPSPDDKKPEFKVKTGMLKKKEGESCELYLEDLAALETVTEDSVLKQLQHRFHEDQVYTFVGDVLVFLNPHKTLDIHSMQYQSKYKGKSRSDNEPHVFAVADAAYQDMLHHNADQHIVLSGETMSGKSTQYRLIMKQLLYIGQTGNKVTDRVMRGYDVLQAFGNAGTPSHADSTRHILHTQVTFSSSGASSGAIFWLYQLEKSRLTLRNNLQANFHILYYLYDSLVKANTLDLYKLDPNTQYRYLRRENLPQDSSIPKGPRENSEGNADKLDQVVENLTALGFEAEESNTIWKTLAAILILGEIEFVLDDEGFAAIKDHSLADKVAELLEVDSKKLGWALSNYCVLESDSVSRRKLSLPEANRARGALARNLYSRLVDWLVNSINQKLSLTRVVYGDKHCVSILDYFGFECFTKNSLEQLFANTFNEEIQYYYNQRVFIAEMLDQVSEEMEGCKLQFLDNKSTLDELMNKPEGVIYLLDEADKARLDFEFVIEGLNKKTKDGKRVEAASEHVFSVAHYTGKVNYDCTAMVQKNRDFIPPELTEALRQSKNQAIKEMFVQRLSKTGNVTAKVDQTPKPEPKPKNKWGAALLESKTTRRYNTLTRGEYSQTRGIRPLGTTYRATCVELMRALSQGSAHFVRCVRTSLGQGFQPTLVRQQIRALSLVDTASAKKTGYSYRVPFDEFLRRYKFLAFDFDETVDETMDNCRLLLVRLKMEGYLMGKNKIFLKYYNQEYLSRLYETQVKKIVKVQCMLRAFLAKRNVVKEKKKRQESLEVTAPGMLLPSMNEEEAALLIQKNLKGYVARKKYGPLLSSSGKLDQGTAVFIRKFAKRWQCKSLFQVLVWYRMARHMDMVYFFQQVHLYNVTVLGSVKYQGAKLANLDQVKQDVDTKTWMGEVLPQAWRLPLNMKDLPFWDSTPLCPKYDEPPTGVINYADRWDEPFARNYKGSPVRARASERRKENVSKFIGTPYYRDPRDTEKFYANQPGIEVDVMTPKKVRSPVPVPSPRLAKAEEPGPSGLPSPSKAHGYVPPSSISHSQFVRPASQSVPKTPIVHSTNPSNQNNSSVVDFRKHLKKGEGPDPIKELKEKSTRVASEDEAEDPPFNFQAMLRKTNYTRDSLKRDKDENREPMEDPSVVYQVKNKQRKQVTIDEGNEDTNNNNSPRPDLRSRFKRQSSIEVIKAALVRGNSKDGGSLDSNRNPTQNGESKVELAPGIVVYGSLTEL